MMNNLLLNKIKDIQNEYLILLKSYASRFNNENYTYLIDEINLFWYKYRRLIKMFLERLDSSIDVYILTGITYLDVKNKKHYPFVMLGEMHIYDDPICSYSDSVQHAEETDFAKKMKEIILLIVENNIKILENCCDSILILPVRLLNQPNNDIIFKLANKAFLDMFVNKELTIENYKEIYNTFEDIVRKLKPEIKESIILSDNDNIDNSLNERFEIFKTNEFLPTEFLRNDVEIFYGFVFGYLSQAIDIISVCTYFKLIPILESNVTYYYVNLLINNFVDKDLDNILIKISLAYILNNTFNYKLIDDICFEEYIKKTKEYEFYSKVLLKVNENNILNTDNLINISLIINDEMKKMLNNNI